MSGTAFSSDCLLSLAGGARKVFANERLRSSAGPSDASSPAAPAPLSERVWRKGPVCRARPGAAAGAASRAGEGSASRPGGYGCTPRSGRGVGTQLGLRRTGAALRRGVAVPGALRCTAGTCAVTETTSRAPNSKVVLY